MWVNYYGRTLFALLNPAKTTITCPSNLIYHDDVDGEFGAESDEGGGSDDDEESSDVDDARRTPEIVVVEGEPILISASVLLVLLLPLLLGPCAFPYFRQPLIVLICFI